MVIKLFLTYLFDRICLWIRTRHNTFLNLKRSQNSNIFLMWVCNRASQSDNAIVQCAIVTSLSLFWSRRGLIFTCQHFLKLQSHPSTTEHTSAVVFSPQLVQTTRKRCCCFFNITQKTKCEKNIPANHNSSIWSFKIAAKKLSKHLSNHDLSRKWVSRT